jgi:hypothetical protein
MQLGNFQKIDTLRNTYLKDISDEDIGFLKETCRLHTIEHKTGKMPALILFFWTWGE